MLFTPLLSLRIIDQETLLVLKYLLGKSVCFGINKGNDELNTIDFVIDKILIKMDSKVTFTKYTKNFKK